MKLTYMAAAIATIAPTFLGVTPARAAEAPDTAVTVPDRLPPEGSEEDGAGPADDGNETGPTAAPTLQLTASAAPHAKPGGKSREAVDAPDLRLANVPDAIVAGGDWRDFSIVIDNPNGTLENWGLDMSLNGIEGVIHGETLRVQVHVDGGWRDARLMSPPDDPDKDFALLETFTIPTGRTTVPVRIRAAADAPLVDFFINAVVFDDDEAQSDGNYWEPSKIVAPSEEGEEPGEGEAPGGEEKPGGGERPGGGQESGGGSRLGKGSSGSTAPVASGSSADGSGDRSAPGHSDGVRDTAHKSPSRDASLAATGSHASDWILGAGGASVALGTVLAAAARRRRRVAP
ncbi:hypothetical protein [Streptomyces sp. NPDC087300]|uniref:hypothetical protein n=1 Tax=Streptomyces sp. NPDC087300 TaxID=3365780 RepID=UPI00381D9DDF